MGNRRELRGLDLNIWLLAGATGIVTQLWLLYFNPVSPLLHGMGFLATVVFLTFVRLSARNLPTEGRHRVPWYDWLFAFSAFIPFLYAAGDYSLFVRRAAVPNPIDVWMGILAVALLFEAGRRATGLFLPALGLLGCAYALSSFVVPYEWGIAPTLTLRRVVGTLYMTELGLFSEPTQVALRWIFLFILFGQALSLAGGLQFFERLAIGVAGHRRGGPAYVSVLSSALIGTVSGSNVANVMMGGQFTIPLMIRVGYGRIHAAAIEAVSSTGGALTPPIMGAAALIMAELTSTPYAKVIAAAALPAILYYVAIATFVWGFTLRLGISAQGTREPLNVFELLAGFWYVPVSMGWLMWRVIQFYPLEHAAIQATGIAVLGGLITSFRSFSLPALKAALASFTDGLIEVALACGVSGVLVGVILVTGIGIELSGTIVALGKESLIIALFATMFVVIILGMAVPGIAAYIIAASVAAPPLAELGVPILAAHIFIFYFSLFAGLTPPVALTVFAAAGIAKSDPMATAVAAVKIAAPAYLLAYFVVLQPELLLLRGDVAAILHTFATAMLGVFSFAIGCSGAWFRKLGRFPRGLLVFSGVLLIHGSLLTDVIGLMAVMAIGAANWHQAQSDAEGHREPSTL